MKPEWKYIDVGEYDTIHWCEGCGVLKIKRLYRKKPSYLVPRREKQRRLEKKHGMQR